MYTPNLLGMDPQTARIIRDLADRVNYLTTRLEQIDGTPVDTGARRENPQPGIISLPGQGAPGFIRVSPDGVIKSYSSLLSVSSNGQIVGLPYNIVTRSDVVNNTGAGPDTLHTSTIDPGTLKAGDFIDFWFGGSFASNDNDKGVDADLAGTLIAFSGNRDIDQGQVDGWVIAGRIFILTSTTVLASTIHLENTLAVDSAGTPGTFGEGFFTSTRNRNITISNLDTTGLVLSCHGSSAAAAANDVFQNMSIINHTRKS